MSMTPPLEAFPLWRSALIAANEKPERLSSLEDLLKQCAEFHAAGSIPNARWKDAVDTVNRAFRKSWERLYAPVYGLLEALKDQFYGHTSAYEAPTVATFARLPKKLARLPDHPIVHQMKAFLTEVAPVAVQLSALKGMAIKRVARVEPENAAYRPPQPSTPAERQVLDLLETILADSFERLVQLFTQRNQGWLAEFQEAAAGAGSEETRPIRGNRHAAHMDLEWHFSTKRFVRGALNQGLESVNQNAVRTLRAVVARDSGMNGERAVEFHPDAAQRLADQARLDAETLKNLFLTKNLRKIASVIEAKGMQAQAVVKGHTVNLQGLQGTLRFTFPDGSAFTVQNSVVVVVNSHNTQFCRFPLTFHQVVLADGSRMSQPSEERMNTVFVDKRPESKAVPETPAGARPRRSP